MWHRAPGDGTAQLVEDAMAGRWVFFYTDRQGVLLEWPDVLAAAPSRDDDLMN